MVGIKVIIISEVTMSDSKSYDRYPHETHMQASRSVNWRPVDSLAPQATPGLCNRTDGRHHGLHAEGSDCSNFQIPASGDVAEWEQNKATQVRDVPDRRESAESEQNKAGMSSNGGNLVAPSLSNERSGLPSPAETGAEEPAIYLGLKEGCADDPSGLHECGVDTDHRECECVLCGKKWSNPEWHDRAATPLPEATERERFEKWAVSEGWPIERNEESKQWWTGTYRNAHTQGRWEGWQASRKAGGRG